MFKWINGLYLTVVIVSLISCSRSKDHYFASESKQIQAKAGNTTNGYQEFLKDTLTQLTEEDDVIDLIEISKFSDSLSIRYLTKKNKTYRAYIKTSLIKHSAHLSSMYLQLNSKRELGHVNFKKLVSDIESHLNRNLYQPNYIGDYFANNTYVKNIYYVANKSKLSDTYKTSNLGANNHYFEFDKNDTNNNSLNFVNCILNNCGSLDFESLWLNNFVSDGNFDACIEGTSMVSI